MWILMQWLYAFLPIFWFYAFYAGRWLTPSDHPPPLPLPRNGGMAMAIPMTFLEDWLLVRMIDKYNLVRFLYTVLSNKKLITAIISKKKKKKRIHTD